MCEKVWKSLKKCEKVWKSAENILSFSCCPLVFLWAPTQANQSKKSPIRESVHENGVHFLNSECSMRWCFCEFSLFPEFSEVPRFRELSCEAAIFCFGFRRQVPVRTSFWNSRRRRAIFRGRFILLFVQCRGPPTTHHPHKRPPSSNGIFGGGGGVVWKLSEPKKKEEYAPPPIFALAMLIVNFVGVVRGFRILTMLAFEFNQNSSGGNVALQTCRPNRN